MSKIFDPHEAQEYQKFIDSMIPYCHCRSGNRPCDGVLAGGVCDGISEDEPAKFDDEED